MVSQKPKYCKSFERNSHWRKISMIMVWERYCNASPKPEFFFIFFVYIFIHISANMSPFGLKFSQMILHTETSKLMYNWSFLFVVLHKPTLLPSTSKAVFIIFPKLETRFNTHYQNAYANAFRNMFLGLVRLSSRAEGLVTAQLHCAVWPVEQRSCRAHAFT